MHCEDYTELLSARLDGELTVEEENALEEHLAHCPDCRAVAQELESIHLSFESLEPVPAPEHFARDVMAEIEGPRVVPLFRRPAFKSMAGLAACLVLCVGLWQGGMFRQEQNVPAEARTGMYTLEAQPACTLSRLPQGTGLEDGDWFLDEDGVRCLMISTEQLEHVEKLAEEQKISFHMEGESASGQSVLLRVTDRA